MYQNFVNISYFLYPRYMYRLCHVTLWEICEQTFVGDVRTDVCWRCVNRRLWEMCEQTFVGDV